MGGRRRPQVPAPQEDSGIDSADRRSVQDPRFLGLADSLGSIEIGKRADLVLLEGDPLVDIRNTRWIVAVVANGRLVDRTALDALLADAIARAPRGVDPSRKRNRDSKVRPGGIVP
jgi:cytosine/adenosine deaminase-related metal-dependent hydrolase